MITAIIILSLIVVVLGFTTINLLRKNEKQEDILLGYLKYLDNISRVIEVSDEKIKKIDIKGSFEGDDEVGFFFKSIKEIQEILNDFNVKKDLRTMDHIIEKNKKERKGRVYFTKETEAAIVKYNASIDKEERSDIYIKTIYIGPFYKLTQNIIHTFKFYYTEVENLEDLTT